MDIGKAVAVSNVRNKILFLCTGNYYRSRFAEMWFNHLATTAGLDWVAESRGLATERNGHLVGPISLATVAALAALGVALPAEHRAAIACSAGDLQGASHVVALKEAEHRPLLVERFPGWEGRVQYWHVHDLDGATAAQALAEIRNLVESLLFELPRELNGEIHLNRARAGV
ncbi:low molecular weight phosphatase family protein [soil metagenome]